ncbi:MAG: hypothetical protein QME72_10020 [Rhodococcus sp. (in: high G+C Gram-positive bacteria)]|nr:hypothetical protein [Rhodococcus sp. (in: high G+C Gram-positive bacteria)]MDI6628043.1 hypothetical protein [Rhodococcus sp. (in: high G+C Gram-positive bacteria)]
MDYAQQNPTDFIGINKLAEETFGKSVEFSVNGIEGPVDAQTADEVFHRKDAPVDPNARAVPVDAFSVGGYWLPSAGRVATYMGTWDFRDDYVNGSAPDDYASVMVDFSSGCFNMASVTYNSFTYDNENTSAAMYTKDGGVGGSPIVGLRDQPSGFKLNVDHGLVQATVARNFGCSSATSAGAQFSYEHNQDGESALTVGASFSGGLSVGYDAPETALQKGTPATYLSF